MRGIIPAATQLHHFGAIEEALAAITDEVGLTAHHRVGEVDPLVRAAQVKIS